MNNILLLGSQHGNELLGEHLYSYIARKRPELLSYITYKTGNLRAHKQNVRYLESDLNRSYNGKRVTYEERRAERLLRFIKKEAFDLVLDLHTTTCVQPPCLIIPSIHSDIRDFLRATSIENVVHMSHSIVTSSLIGVYSKAVSIEVNRANVTDEMMEELCNDIARYIRRISTNQFKKVYEVRHLLKKTELSTIQAAALRNFEQSTYGYYPILIGENSYKKYTEYLGFKAYKVRVIKV